MNLSVLERVICLSLLPVEGSFATLRILMDLRLSLSFSEDEMKEWSINQDGIKTIWQVNGEAEIPIGEKATDIIVDALKKRDHEGKLPIEAISLYEKFIPTE